MEPVIVRQLRMERRQEVVSLPQRDEGLCVSIFLIRIRVAAFGWEQVFGYTGDFFYGCALVGDEGQYDGGADKYAGERLVGIAELRDF